MISRCLREQLRGVANPSAAQDRGAVGTAYAIRTALKRPTDTAAIPSISGSEVHAVALQ